MISRWNKQTSKTEFERTEGELRQQTPGPFEDTPLPDSPGKGIADALMRDLESIVAAQHYSFLKRIRESAETCINAAIAQAVNDERNRRAR